ncbi:type I-F CRISPR-associated protein Csy2 [Thiomicrorhabdus hydrogeniphila]
MKLITLPHIKVHNANAMSSPYTIGFPAMTAWLGAVHALQRKLQTQGFEQIRFDAVGVVCHHLDLQTHKDVNAYESVIIGTANPLDKSGKRPSFIEEARCHLEVSLVLEYQGIYQNEMADFLSKLSEILSTLKMASGDVLSFKTPVANVVNDETQHRKLMAQLMPGYALIERKELMQEAMEAGQDALDALLDGLKVTHSSQLDEEGHVTWSSSRAQSGWIVPIATGFHGISELGKAQNQRDSETPHRFAESLVTLGEFKMSYRITDLNQLLWRYQTDLTNNLYFCTQTQHNISQ